MSEFRILFKIDNDAFVDGRDAEIARILRDVADRLDEGQSGGNVRDYNGNTVGDFGIRIDGVMP